MLRRIVVMTAALGAGTAALAAQQGGAFVVRLGTDTLAVEQYTRTATQLRGEQVIRSPRSMHRIYTVTYRADGSVERFELVTHNIGGGPGPMETRATAEFGASAVTMRVPRGDSSVAVSAPVPGPAAPWAINVFGLTEDVLRRARAAGGESVSVPIVSLGATEADTATVLRHGDDSLVAGFGGIGPFRIRADAAGTLLGLSGIGGTSQVTVERVPSLDMAAFGPAFANRPLGVLSPADSVITRVGSAAIAVRYSRPAMRGRAIFGVMVPWDRVWRTGANSATLFETSADLVIGGTAVPAGKYSLYSIPSRTGWTLIINRNTGQWGTSYDAEHDLARIAMEVTPLAQAVEQFTIAVEREGELAGVLSLAWERTRAAVRFTVQ
jgi:hypothetical protein